MLIAFLAAAILFFAALCAFLAFDNRMLKQENILLEGYNQFLLRRAKRAEWKEAQSIAGRVRAERDALSANAEAVEAQTRVDRLSAHVAALLRQGAHDVRVAFTPRQTYHIHRAAPVHLAAARQPENN